MVISTSLITFARGCWRRRCSFKLLMFHVKQLVVDLGRAMSGDVVGQLAETIAARRRAAADKSYTRQLLDAGPERCARKFGEEAIEAVIAGLAADPQALAGEAADVIYHLLVLLEVRGVAWKDVVDVLARRTTQSGLAEKAARTPTDG